MRRWLGAVVAVVAIGACGIAQASVNLPLHHWAYEAIERLVAMGVVERAMVVPKPYSWKEAAKYMARTIQQIRNDEIELDGREAIAEPLLDRLMKELGPELAALGAVAPPREAKAAASAVLFLASDRSSKTTGAVIPVDGGVREAFPR